MKISESRLEDYVNRMIRKELKKEELSDVQKYFVKAIAYYENCDGYISYCKAVEYERYKQLAQVLINKEQETGNEPFSFNDILFDSFFYKENQFDYKGFRVRISPAKTMVHYTIKELSSGYGTFDRTLCYINDFIYWEAHELLDVLDSDIKGLLKYKEEDEKMEKKKRENEIIVHTIMEAFKKSGKTLDEAVLALMS